MPRSAPAPRESGHRRLDQRLRLVLFAAVFVLVNALVDGLYVLANPRIRYGTSP